MTWRIRIEGQVQGVGFRPYVWRLATQHHLRGSVSNGLAGVDIQVNGEPAIVQSFFHDLVNHPPAGSHIANARLSPCVPTEFEVFSIVESSHTGEPSVRITPDVALCAACRTEFADPNNRRAQYPFITCTYCGPRFSVVETLPYDRTNTSMRHFTMCAHCQSEYDNPADCRFYAQTNSCPVCGVQMSWGQLGTELTHLPPDKVLQQVLARWEAGEIVAIKGIGGYLLTCDATQAEAVTTLRARKQRRTKPFAVMYPTLEMLRVDVYLTHATAQWLQHAVAPIVLLDVRPQPASGLAVAAIAPGLDQVGVMLPYAPLFEWLLSAFQKPIVATSGNAHAMPMVYEETQVHQLYAIATAVLSHNRPIVTPQDDSVLALAEDQSVWLRRARGLAPQCWLPTPIHTNSIPVLAMGADMKSAFAVGQHDYVFLSQYIGNLSSYDTQQRYEQLVEKALERLKIRPAMVLTDLHPGYMSTQLGQRWAAEWGIPHHAIQHHHAHAAAVLAENGLLESPQRILCVVWDGTGWGFDRQVWGGEFFQYQERQMTRVAHFPYFPWILGDQMAREPRLSAFALWGADLQAASLLSPMFNPREWEWYTHLYATHRGLQTSSVGRLFDAVAALLGLCTHNTYEGEAALYLAVAARRYIRQAGLSACKGGYLTAEDGVDSTAWQSHLLHDVRIGKPTAYVAAMFHATLVQIVANAATRGGYQHLAFSGGVFQNTLLVAMLQAQLGQSHTLYFHQNVSPNDENIALGQWIIFNINN